MRKRLPLALVVCFALVLFAFVPTASADIVFGDVRGPDAGQTDDPKGIAVDLANGTVYVADRNNNRVDVFEADGDFLRAFGWDVAPDGAPGDTVGDTFEICTALCQAGTSGVGAGQFDLAFVSQVGNQAIAVDNDPLSPSYRDVYVADGNNFRVQRFTPAGAFVLAFGDGVNQTTTGDVCTAASGNICGAGTSGTAPGEFSSSSRIGLGSGGVVHVLGDVNRLQKFDSSGAFVTQLSLLPADLGGVNGLAVDSAGNFYAASGGETGAVRKYDSTGALLFTFNGSFNIKALAVDATDSLFVSDLTGGQPTAVYEYDSSGALLRVRYGNGTLRAHAVSLAPYTNAQGDLFALENSNPLRLAHIAFEPPGPVVLPAAAQVGANQHEFDNSDTKATSVDNLTATLNTRVNPEGRATTVHFEYVDDASFQADGFSSANTVRTPESASIGEDFLAHPASFDIPCASPGSPDCLIPDTVYRFRAIASNADGTHTGPTASFRTLPPITLGDIWSTDVAFDTATLHAQLNPNGVAATAHFEYVEEATYLADKSSGDGFQNAIETPELFFGDGTAQLTRSATIDSLAPGAAYRYRYVANDFFGEFTGPEATFTTHVHMSLNTDCPNQQFRTAASATLPDCRAHEMVSPLDKNGADIVSLVYLQFDSFGNNRFARLEQATPLGDGLTYSSYQAFGEDAQAAPYSSQYLAFRNSENGWSTQSISPPRSSVSLYPATSPSSTPQFRAFSEDLCDAWFIQDTDVQLAPEAPPGVPGLYRRHNAAPGCGAAESYEALSGAEPSGHISESGLSTSYSLDLQGFSADGARAVFRANDRLLAAASTATAPDPDFGGGIKPIYQLYIAEGGAPNPDRLVSVLPDGGASDANSAAHAVSPDGTRVFFVTGGKLYLRLNADQPESAGECTEPAKACTIRVSETVSPERAVFWATNPQATRALFTIEAGPLTGSLYEFNLASRSSTLIASGVRGVVGASEDLSRVYLVSTQLLDPDPNSEGDTATPGQPNLYLHEGGGFDFVATLFDLGGSSVDRLPYAVDPGGRTSRVSADGLSAAFMIRAPITGYDNTDGASGQPDAEVFLYDAEANGGAGDLLCASCNPSGARPRGRVVAGGGDAALVWAAAVLPLPQTSLRASRALSTDGDRLFFESFDALLPADTNDAADVYQWEAPGSGDCDTADANYFDLNKGCLSLISSGKSAKDSRFVDASANGSDVFFATDSSLLTHDPSFMDIYDARVNGGFPPPPPPPPPCEGEACRGPGSSEGDVTGAGTRSFEGKGDPEPVFRKSCAPYNKRAAAKARAAKRAAHKGQAKRARALRRQANSLRRKAKRCRRAAR